MPLFPTDRNFCTRTTILVRLRRGTPSIPTMRVVDSKTLKPVDGESEIMMAAEQAAEMVKGTMNRIAGSDKVCICWR